MGEGQNRREVGRRVGGCQNYSQHITPGWGKAVWGNHVWFWYRKDPLSKKLFYKLHKDTFFKLKWSNFYKSLNIIINNIASTGRFFCWNPSKIVKWLAYFLLLWILSHKTQIILPWCLQEGWYVFSALTHHKKQLHLKVYNLGLLSDNFLETAQQHNNVEWMKYWKTKIHWQNLQDIIMLNM